MAKEYKAKFKHPLKADDITEENYGKVANDLFLCQCQAVHRQMEQMLDLDGWWGDDDIDYYETMRDAHHALQHIAYEESREDLIKFLFTPRDDYEFQEQGHNFMPLDYINSAGGLCAELEAYLPKEDF